MKNKGNLISWLILAALGVLLIVGQRLVKNALYIILAIGLILAALSGIVGWWKEKSRSKDAIVNLLGCIVMLLIGIWILANPSRFDTLINVVIGLVLIVTGIMWLFRGYKQGKDLIIMILGGIALVLGLFIAFTNAATSWAVIAEGVGLIYTAVTGFIAEKRLKA